jgi:hypothetical protein
MSFHRFQRVRIVRHYYPEFIGMECTLMEWAEDIVGPRRNRDVCGWETDIPHPQQWLFGGGLCVTEDQIEPLKYEPDAADLATQSGSPDFNCPLPVRAA